VSIFFRPLISRPGAKSPPTMVDAMRAMLDSLMGKDRNEVKEGARKLSPEEQRRKRLNDPELCKYFLCGFCPNDLFLNTRVSLGHCDQKHDEGLAEMWNTLAEKERRSFGFVELFMARLQQLVDEMDRKVTRHKDRMEDENARCTQIDPETRDLLAELGAKITTMTAEMERLSEEGDIEGSRRAFQEVEAAKLRKEGIMSQVQASLDRPGQNRLKAVCDICSAFTMTSDTEGRIQDHLQGKQHQGYLKIRETLRQMKLEVRTRSEREDRMAVDKEKEKRDRDKERRARDRERGMHRDLEARVKETKEGETAAATPAEGGEPAADAPKGPDGPKGEETKPIVKEEPREVKQEKETPEKSVGRSEERRGDGARSAGDRTRDREKDKDRDRDSTRARDRERERDRDRGGPPGGAWDRDRDRDRGRDRDHRDRSKERPKARSRDRKRGRSPDDHAAARRRRRSRSRD